VLPELFCLALLVIRQHVVVVVNHCSLWSFLESLERHFLLDV
jgi:hypothetical protein